MTFPFVGSARKALGPSKFSSEFLPCWGAIIKNSISVINKQLSGWLVTGLHAPQKKTEQNILRRDFIDSR